MYQRVITPSGEKPLKRLPKSVQEELLRSSEMLTSDPYAGEKLHGSLHLLYSWHFKYQNVNYRAAYTIDTQQALVVIHYVGPRENFYDRLRRLFHA